MKEYKSRKKSAELLILELLNKKKSLSTKDKQHYLNLKKGFEGEKLFDSLTARLEYECIILNDLLLKINNTVFQIDTLIITSHKVYIFEVKNYVGEFYFEGEKFFKIPQYEIINPLHQLSRSESLLRQLFSKHGINLSIEASVIFINSEFTLYQAPLNKPIIPPTKINGYLNQLNTISSKLKRNHKLYAEKLMSLHIEESPYYQLPDYNYNELKKGICCIDCDSFSISVVGVMCVCKECGHREKAASAIKRTVEEFKLLFPEQKITTNIIHEWCQVIDSKKRVRRILKKNYTKIGTNRWIYFE
ncbi:nuclease [Virgibacillus profundi]|uniref:Nuclease n=1 Tax=Virgibacillus profundi TaxID=2024555 RepID=A0A2A2IAI0_9BACI|nr:nuclease-related domain-containing protein [Virgibacillus profundi]PAV28053.1 nuclease [Virgibacillus profundi]PXY52357.1 NERD domain-containing protein [Virgibacillus profundi]